MADLTIPKGQTYPFIRGYLADEDGAMDEQLQAADALSFVFDDGPGGDPLELTVEYVEGETMLLDDAVIPVNFQADYSASAMSDSEHSWRGKLKIVHDEAAGWIQYCPKDGFVEITISTNVTEGA